MPAGLLDSLRSRSALAFVATCCAVQFLGLLDTSMVSLALPSIARDLRLDTASLQWVLSAYGISFAGFVLVGGSVADLLGRRRTVLIGLAVLGTGSLASAAAPALPVLLAARAAQGLGAAIMLPAALALLVVNFEEGPSRHRAFGAWAASGGAALVCGGVLGGFLSGHLGWRAAFGCTAVLVAGSALLAAALPEDRHAGAARRIDLAGAVLTVLCLTLLVCAAGQAQASGWAAPTAVLPFAGAVLSALAFVLVETRSPAPMVRLGILRTPGLAGANLLCLVFPAGFLGALFLGSLLLQSVYGFSGPLAGLAILPFSGTVLAGTSLAPALIDRCGRVRVAVTGFGLLAAGLLGMSAATTGGYAGRVLPSLVLLGAGAALGSVPLALGAVAGVSTAESGMATGLLSTAQQAGGALMLAVLAGVTAAGTPGRGGHQVAGPGIAPGLQAGFLAAAALCAAAAVLAPWLLRTGVAARTRRAEMPAPTAV